MNMADTGIIFQCVGLFWAKNDLTAWPSGYHVQEDQGCFQGGHLL